MKNIKYYYVLILISCNFSLAKAQMAAEANKTSVLNLQTDQYEIALSKYGDGKQNLSWEEGGKLFGMGGSLQDILEKLFDEFDWKVDKKWLRDNYYLRINYNSDSLSKQEVNKIFLQQLANTLSANVEKSKIKKVAICIDWASSKGNVALQKAQDRNSVNQIIKRNNELQINSVKLGDLDRLVNLNSAYNLIIENEVHSSYRFDFSFDIKTKDSFIKDLEGYGFQVNECEVEKIQVSLY
jgi:hypothetical protein